MANVENAKRLRPVSPSKKTVDDTSGGQLKRSEIDNTNTI